MKTIILPLYAKGKTHFECLLNSVTTDGDLQNVKECLQNTNNLCHGNNILLTPCMIQNVMDKLKSGKHVATMGYLPNALCIPIGTSLYCCPFSLIELSLMDLMTS